MPDGISATTHGAALHPQSRTPGPVNTSLERSERVSMVLVRVVGVGVKPVTRWALAGDGLACSQYAVRQFFAIFGMMTYSSSCTCQCMCVSVVYAYVIAYEGSDRRPTVSYNPHMPRMSLAKRSRSYNCGVPGAMAMTNVAGAIHRVVKNNRELSGGRNRELGTE